MRPEEYCRDKVARPGTNLYYSLLFLPESRRHAATALYAYQKEILDTVAECTDLGVAYTKLQWWQEEIERLFAGRPRHPVAQALAEPIKRYHLPPVFFLKVIEGAGRDLGQSTYPSFQVLASHCYQIAGTISQMAAEIYGYQNTLTQQYAENLGIALRLTYILRNVRQDAEQRRIYLPRDELVRFKITEEEILTKNDSSAEIQALFAYQANRIRQYFQTALTHLDPADCHWQRAGLIQSALQLAALNTMEKDGYPVLQQQVTLTPLYKLWLAWRTMRRARRGQMPPVQPGVFG